MLRGYDVRESTKEDSIDSKLNIRSTISETERDGV